MDGPSSLHPDTTATLLLCGRFGAVRERAKLLSPSEYHELGQWLDNHGLAFGDLMGHDAKHILRTYPARNIAGERLLSLLHRADELDAAMAQWSNMGIWVACQTDPQYPLRLRQRLKLAGLPLLFGAGPRSVVDGGGVCIVGSRDSSEAAVEFARLLSARCGQEGLTVVSSDMRGVDREAITSALDHGGKVICVVSDCLEKALAARRHRAALAAGRLAMVTPFSPETRFKVANAIRANKYQYALSDVAVIVETREKGGVWLGAEENRHEGWVPAFVRTGDNMSPNNMALLHLGLLPITRSDIEQCESVRDFFVTHGLTPRRGPAAMRVPTVRTEPAVASTVGTAFDLYALFATELKAMAAATTCTEADIAAHFGIELDQTRKWLARAVAEGLLRADDDGYRTS